MDRMDLMAHRRASDNAVLASYDYTYRADGKRTGLNESFSTTTARSNSYTWSYDNAGRLISEVLDSSDNSVDQTESYVYDLVGNRMRKEVNKPATAYVDQIFAYNYDANDRITSETLDNGVNGTGVDSTTTYGWNGTQQATRSVSEGSITRSVQSMSYGLAGQLERVVTTTSNGSGTVTGRTRVDYRYTPQGIRTISVDWNDANLDGTFAAGERTGSIEYLIDNANFTGYQQTILETVKNAAGQATKRTSYTFGVDEITQTTTLPLPGGGEGWGEGETLTFAHDGKGSVRALFGAAAAIAQVFTYSAYGELLAIHNGSGTLQPLTSSLTSVLYNGEGLDARTGLYNIRARWYSASNARWERLDPFAGNPTDPFSFNKYGFVHGDPVGMTDPTGMFGLGGISVSIGSRLSMAASKIGAALVVYDRVDTVTALAKLVSQFLATGTVNPVEVASLAASIIPGSGIFKKIKAVVPASFTNALNLTGRLDGASSFLTEAARNFPGTKYLYNVDGGVSHIATIFNRWKEDVGEMGLGLIAEKMGLQLWKGRIRNGQKGVDNIFRQGNKWFIGEAKGTKALKSNLADHLNDLPAGHQQMSKYWILEKIDEIRLVDANLAGELENAMSSGRLFGLLSVTQLDDISGVVSDPRYVVKAFDQIGDFFF